MIIWLLVLASVSTIAGCLRGNQSSNAKRGYNSKRAPEEVEGAILEATEHSESAREMWLHSSYCWVVVCKNHGFHHHPNTFNVHRIPLGETDTVAPRPPIKRSFAARCSECGREYRYKPSDVLRWEMEVPSSFVPHPLFRE